LSKGQDLKRDKNRDKNRDKTETKTATKTEEATTIQNPHHYTSQITQTKNA